jgi:hypothetical protein
VNPERPLVDDRIGVAGGGQRVVLHRPDGLSVAAVAG